MPTLTNENRPLKRVLLPSSKPEDEAWIDIYTELLVEDSLGLPNDEVAAGIIIASRIIKDWAFTEKDGITKQAITSENIKHLTLNDFVFLSGLVSDLKAKLPLSDEKKS